MSLLGMSRLGLLEKQFNSKDLLNTTPKKCLVFCSRPCTKIAIKSPKSHITNRKIMMVAQMRLLQQNIGMVSKSAKNQFLLTTFMVNLNHGFSARFVPTYL
jgi:hypothetical protein